MEKRGIKVEHSRSSPPVRLIAWEVTRSCKFKCLHCRASARDGLYSDELTTEECEKLLENIASFSKPIIILTGGEPLLREDIFHIIEFGRSLGLKMVMASCSPSLNRDLCKKLKRSGVERISLSIDSPFPEKHDFFRGVSGAFEAMIRVFKAVRGAGLEFQINSTITRMNMDDLPGLLRLAEEQGAVSFHPFLLVPTGRAKELTGYTLSAREYEGVLKRICEQSIKSNIDIKPTCAPHYSRICAQRGLTGSSVRGTITRGCLGGHGFAFISHRGVVQICGFLDRSAGELRPGGFDFRSIWNSSPFFKRIRSIESYKGKCGLCEYWKICGGCRARGLSVNGDCFAEEPFCLYRPKASKT
ncbi:Radical SAM domain heme biosynthesis protein [Chitinispirillum alkaliphilum]|nr:Radical SAM domain heme biosynthesis protein [Chitinispirillum alkaliphilum]